MLVQKYVAAFMYFQDAATLGKTSPQWSGIWTVDLSTEWAFYLFRLTPTIHSVTRQTGVYLLRCGCVQVLQGWSQFLPDLLCTA